MSTSAASDFLGALAPRERELVGRGPDWLQRLRREGRRRFEELGFPGPREEAWRATNVAPIAALRFAAPGAEPADVQERELPAIVRPAAAAARLCFVDGRLRAELSAEAFADAGLWAGSLSRALREIPERVRAALSEPDGATEHQPFRALNTAFLEEGALVLVRKNCDVELPVHIAFVTTGRGEPTVAQPRVAIAVEAGARVRVVESYVAIGDGRYFTNAVTEAFLGEDAELDHCRVQLEGTGGYHVGALTTRQSRSSRLAACNIDLGGRLVRHDLEALLDGEGATCRLDGLYLTCGEQHVDNHTTLVHARPHCDSRELYKGILTDRSRTVFNGRIVVRPGAQKTDAKQSNPNLVLSDGALAHTRPQLEIYADDVKCTHGATVGRLDEEAIFYMRSRGIERQAAHRVLIRAFADEVLDRIEHDELRDHLRAEVAARLERAAADRA